MNGQVKKLCDIESLQIPAELLCIHLDEAQIEAQIRGLSLRYAKEEAAQTAEPGDIVHCTADQAGYPDGRTVLLFIGMHVPGAEAAEQAACGKKTGDVFTAEIGGRSVVLTVQKIVRRTPVEVNDALIASLHMDGMQTVEDYRAQLRRKAQEDAEMEQNKMLVAFYIDQMTEQSEYEYDEAEANAFADRQMPEVKRQCEEVGEPFDEAQIRESIIMQQKQMWMAEAFCKTRGIEISETEIEEQANQMAEMMGLMGEPVPDHAEMLEMARQDAAMNGLFGYIGQVIAEKTGGANGNG